MKKLVLTISIVLGMTLGASAQYFGDNGQPQGGGLFGRGENPNYANDDGDQQMPLLPPHNSNDNHDAAPLGSGAMLLIGMGAAYALANRKEKK